MSSNNSADQLGVDYLRSKMEQWKAKIRVCKHEILEIAVHISYTAKCDISSILKSLDLLITAAQDKTATNMALSTLTELREKSTSMVNASETTTKLLQNRYKLLQEYGRYLATLGRKMKAEQENEDKVYETEESKLAEQEKTNKILKQAYKTAAEEIEELRSRLRELRQGGNNASMIHPALGGLISGVTEISERLSRREELHNLARKQLQANQESFDQQVEAQRKRKELVNRYLFSIKELGDLGDEVIRAADGTSADEMKAALYKQKLANVCDRVKRMQQRCQDNGLNFDKKDNLELILGCFIEGLVDPKIIPDAETLLQSLVKYHGALLGSERDLKTQQETVAKTISSLKKEKEAERAQMGGLRLACED